MGCIFAIMILTCLLYYRVGPPGQREFGLVAAILVALIYVINFIKTRSTRRVLYTTNNTNPRNEDKRSDSRDDSHDRNEFWEEKFRDEWLEDKRKEKEEKERKEENEYLDWLDEKEEKKRREDEEYEIYLEEKRKNEEEERKYLYRRAYGEDPDD